MIRLMAALIVLIVLMPAPLIAETRRQLDAHEHGHGTLNIAIEGKQILMELRAPGTDIVGFEHAAKSDKDKVRVEAAEKSLSDPLALFSLPGAAGCSVKSAEVEGALAGSHHEEKHGHNDDKHTNHGEKEAHSEFHVEYVLTCSNISAITWIEFPYFERFPRAEVLKVNMITGKSQKAFEVKRNNPVIAIRGII
jgi:hypothetical protein